MGTLGKIAGATFALVIGAGAAQAADQRQDSAKSEETVQSVVDKCGELRNDATGAIQFIEGMPARLKSVEGLKDINRQVYDKYVEVARSSVENQLGTLGLSKNFMQITKARGLALANNDDERVRVGQACDTDGLTPTIPEVIQRLLNLA